MDPHAHKDPVVLIANVVLRPAATIDQFVSVPTCTGVDLFVTSPSPSCESEFVPHPHKVPVVLIANAEYLPANTVDQSVAAPTCTGDDLFVTSPSPSLPFVPLPHAHKVPVVLIAWQNESPDDICEDQLVSVPICTGDDLDVTSRRPS